MPGTVDWGAIAKLAGSLGNSNLLNSTSKLSTFGTPDESSYSSPTGAHNTSWQTTGLVPGADVGRFTGPVSLPSTYQGPTLTGGERFTWSIDDTGAHTQQITQMTLAGSLSWLRNLAATNKTQFNEIVQGLVQAGYLDPTKARYGSYTGDVASAFLRSAIDVEQINNDGGNGGQVKTWWNHIDDLKQGRVDSGQINPDGSTGGGSGTSLPTAPTRTDVYTNPEDVKTAINNAAMNVLGRHLTPAEEAQFAAQFHGTEKSFNDQQWGQQWASYQQQLSGAGGANNTNPNVAPDAVGRPSVTDAATNYIDESPNVAADRTQQLLGSYIGVLRNMTGLGSGGISSAVR